ncbi:MAG: flavodoxin [Elusimicrobiota bacterium]|jgi:flavodoxin|nr:flavodoxin [Elusimicrobiota bacterium]
MKNPIKKSLIIIVSATIAALIGIGGCIFMQPQKNNTPQKVTEPEKQVKVGKGDQKILIAYFSVPETDNPNKMTKEEENSAIVVDGKVLGNTQYVAMLINEKIGGDIYRIEPKTPYTTNHKALVAQATEEQKSNARPEIANKISNFGDYDVIYIGYPIWWGDMPQILYTFLEMYDFSGKTVILFSTHGGSRLAGTVNTVKNKLGGATVIKNAFSLSRDNMEQAPKRVDAWLKEIGAD